MANQKKDSTSIFLFGIALLVITLVLFIVPFVKLSVAKVSHSTSGFSTGFGFFTLIKGKEVVANAALWKGFSQSLATVYGTEKTLTLLFSFFTLIGMIAIFLTAIVAIFTALGVIKNKRITAIFSIIGIIAMMICTMLAFMLASRIKQDSGISMSTMIYIPFILNLLASAVLVKGLKN